MNMEENQNTEAEIQAGNIENIKFNQIVMTGHDKVCTTSLIVAEMFEKDHKNVLQAIRNLECSEKFISGNFKPMVYAADIGSGAKRDFPAFNITRDGFSFLTLGFTGKKAAAWKEKFLEAFNAMEKSLFEKHEEFEAPIEAQGDEQVIMPRTILATYCASHFKSRKTISKAQQLGLQGVMHFVAYIEEVTFATVEEYFLKVSQIDSINDLNTEKCSSAISTLLTLVHTATKSVFPPPSTEIDKLELTKNALYGLMDYWKYLHNNLTKKEIENYILNACNIRALEELQTQINLQKALFVIYRGIYLYVSVEQPQK